MILEKLLLGITLAAPIGPVTVEMIQRGLRRGFWSAFSIRLGGAIGNTLWLLFAFFGLSAISDYPGVLKLLGTIGAWCLIWMGLSTLEKFFSKIDLTPNEDHADQSGLWLGFLLGVFNPVAVAFWIGAFAHSMNGKESGHLFALAQNMLIIAGVLLWGAGLSTLLHFGRRVMRLAFIRAVTGLAGLLLVAYGVKYSAHPLEDLLALTAVIGWMRGWWKGLRTKLRRSTLGEETTLSNPQA